MSNAEGKNSEISKDPEEDAETEPSKESLTSEAAPEPSLPIPTLLVVAPPNSPAGLGGQTPLEAAGEQVAQGTQLPENAPNIPAPDGVEGNSKQPAAGGRDGTPVIEGAFAAFPAAADPSAPSSAFSDAQGLLPPSGPAGAAPTAEVKAPPTALQATQVLPSVPLGAVPMTIGLKALGATSRFEIRLDPIELGRIDVALDIDRTRGSVSASLVVERPETLALLQRDASSLQQALSQAGLDASQGITLSLQTGDQGRRSAPDADIQRPGNTLKASDETETTPGFETLPLRALRAIGGIDIRI